MDRRLARSLDWLDTAANRERIGGVRSGDSGDLGTDTVRAVLQLLGDPQGDYPAIHITGTNGKGSTAMLTTRILAEHGLSVGTYASPHLHAVNERIRFNDKPISDEELAEALEITKAVVDTLDPEIAPSWFELVTATALRAFSDQAVDVAVVEVGALGRHDATNVVHSEVAVVTNVAKDHTAGATGWAEEVAGEKAGIITADSTLVLGELNPGLQSIFLAEPAAKQLVRNRDFGCTSHRVAVGGRSLDIRTPRALYDEVFLSLHGAFQVDNAVLAVVASEEFLDAALDDEALRAAFGQARMAGRIEPVAIDPLVIVDGAHNPAGASAAISAIDEEFHVVGLRYLIVGMMDDKDPTEMLSALNARDAELIICCAPDWPRARDAATIAAAARELGASAEVVVSPVEALERAYSLAEPDDMIIVGGSLYVVAAIRQALLDAVEDGSIHGASHRSDPDSDVGIEDLPD